jgi:hypothetical protein
MNKEGETNMKKQILITVSVFAFLVVASSSFAATFCYQDNYGNYYMLAGGKVNAKPFSGRLVVPGVCQVSGNAAIFSKGVNYQVTWNSAQHSHDCSSIIESVTLEPTLTVGFGTFDSGQNGSNDGSIQWTRVDCDTVP